MKNQIIEKLNEIEKNHNVKIIHAVESGSRAWGFPSEDSDYDVRFIYVRDRDSYLSIFQYRDVIEIPINRILDINGWDIKKALLLLSKSNPTLLEWFISPIVYKTHKKAMDPLKALSKEAILPEALCNHYLSMAKGNISKYEDAESVKIKTYLYSLRPALCCKWFIEKMTQPPILFEDLLNEFIPDGQVRNEINKLLEIKINSREKDIVKRSENIEQFLKDEIPLLEKSIPKNNRKTDKYEFDNVFRQILKEQQS